jgi:hypothetical protein
VTAAITKDAATDLDLAPGDPVTVIIKSTEVMLATRVWPDPLPDLRHSGAQSVSDART